MITDYSSLLNLKGRLNTLPDNEKKDLIISLVLSGEININDEIRNELIEDLLKECPDYTEFYENIKDLNDELKDIKLKYKSMM